MGHAHEIPNGVYIPPRGHYLLANADGYSLGAVAQPDQTFIGDIPDNHSFGLWNYIVGNHNLENRIDAVGPTSLGNGLYKEGDGYAPLPVISVEQSVFRSLASGVPRDTDDNAADFLVAGASVRLGAAGPENLASPVNRTARIKSMLLDSAAPRDGAPNRVRDGASVGPTSPLGTLTIRRTFTNTLGEAVTRLRFRVVDITTSPAPEGTADLRVLHSPADTVATSQGDKVLVPLTLDPPSLSDNGGNNATLSVGQITLSEPLPPGASIDTQFRLGVAQNGGFRFFVIVEALPGHAADASASQNKGQTKGQTKAKAKALKLNCR